MKNLIEKHFSLISLLTLLFVFVIPQNPELWKEQFNIGVVFICVGIAYFVSRGTSLLLGVGLAYFLSVSTFPWNDYYHVSQEALASAYSFGFLITIVFFVACLNLKDYYHFINTLALLCVLSSLVLIGKKLMTGQGYFFLNADSSDGAMIAALYPLVAFRPARIYTGKSIDHYFDIAICTIPVIAIFYCGGSTAAAGLAFSFAAWGMSFLGPKVIVAVAKRWLKTVLVGVLLFTSVAVYSSKDGLLNDNGRRENWSRSLKHWGQVTPKEKLFGIGAGSYFILGPKISQESGVQPGSFFPFMHSEPLQILFEQGIIGLIIFILMAIHILQKAYRYPWLFASLSTMLFTSLIQMPLRYYAGALVCALLARAAFFNTDPGVRHYYEI